MWPLAKALQQLQFTSKVKVVVASGEIVVQPLASQGGLKRVYVNRRGHAAGAGGWTWSSCMKSCLNGQARLSKSLRPDLQQPRALETLSMLLSMFRQQQHNNNNNTNRIDVSTRRGQFNNSAPPDSQVRGNLKAVSLPKVTRAESHPLLAESGLVAVICQFRSAIFIFSASAQAIPPLRRLSMMS